MTYDVVIIGAGVSGCAIARELSRYQLRVAVLEKEEDACCGTSKANSGIVHAGFDAKEGSLMARLNVEGNQAMEALSRELDFPFRRNGSLVLMFQEEDRPRLLELQQRGARNGVKNLRIVEREELRRLEPHVGEEAVAALYAPDGGIVCPFGLTIALAENACSNGVEFYFDREVTGIERRGDGWIVKADRMERRGDGWAAKAAGMERCGDGGAVFAEEAYEARLVVNAAGVYADVLHNMVSEKKLHITPRRGEYCLLDKSAGSYVNHTVFQLPGPQGKGVLVTPTAHGNLLVGPTAEDIEDREGTNTTARGLEAIRARAGRSIAGLPMQQAITSFAGLRAHEDGHDFIIGEPEDARGFLDCAGIESPGLSSAPAIGKLVAGLAVERLNPRKKEDFCGSRKGIRSMAQLSREEQAARIREKPAYGAIVCRCEMVTEGEIVEAVNRPLGARSLDGVKRRVRAGMGRCQSGFCSPRVMEILARERGISMEEVTKSGGGSRIICGTNKDSLIDEATAPDGGSRIICGTNKDSLGEDGP